MTRPLRLRTPWTTFTAHAVLAGVYQTHRLEEMAADGDPVARAVVYAPMGPPLTEAEEAAMREAMVR